MRDRYEPSVLVRGDAHVGVRVRPWASMCVRARACAYVSARERAGECVYMRA